MKSINCNNISKMNLSLYNCGRVIEKANKSVKFINIKVSIKLFCIVILYIILEDLYCINQKNYN